MASQDVSPADIREPNRKHVAAVQSLIESNRSLVGTGSTDRRDADLALLGHAEEMTRALSADGTLDAERPRATFEKEVWVRLILQAVMQVLRGILEGRGDPTPTDRGGEDESSRQDQQ